MGKIAKAIVRYKIPGKRERSEFDLKPCPFCGGAPMLYNGTQENLSRIFFVYCFNCEATGREFVAYKGINKEEDQNNMFEAWGHAIQSWNRRA